MRVKIEVDGEEKFSHGSFDDLKEYNDTDSQTFDLELYTVPSVIRKVLKITKLQEIVEVKCSRKDKLTDHFDNPVFSHEWLGSF